MLTRLAPRFVIPLLKHFEAEVKLSFDDPAIRAIVLVMERVTSFRTAELGRYDLKLGSALLRAVAALHDLGVVHKDVKWENVLLGGRVMLCDFGLAQMLDVEGCAPMRAEQGTVDFMAPEVETGSTMWVMASADVFSSGVCLRTLWCSLYGCGWSCGEIEYLIDRTCAENPNKRPSARMALHLWERRVMPAAKKHEREMEKKKKRLLLKREHEQQKAKAKAEADAMKEEK
jgi:hypothetical protein